MHSGRQYSLSEFLVWTRRDIYWLVTLATIPTVLYQLAGCTWLAIPWVPIAMIGTAAAFIVGFRNNATYNRLWEARQIYGAIVNGSRTWGIMVKDFVTGTNSNELHEYHRQLIYRHIAWLTAMRFQLREPRAWENMMQENNREYRQKNFTVAELETKLDDELQKFLAEDELRYVLGKKNRATHVISLQSQQLRQLAQQGLLEPLRHIEMENMLRDFYEQQGKCERIKNFPYPRQFASINQFFIRLFVCMVPFGLLQEFQKLGEHFVWLTIPFSALVGWVFNAMEKVGESTENPFEGSANDVPITAMSRTIEIDLREMLDETDLPPALQPVNKILM
ncbi:bestrophin family protein [Foetidibacter luteolus]|uniref:bestrophin family protein n=1 Tax=Foetidibacter luteolus TaxID=2608880 RepID=UPI00129A8EC6|nr:bestrophin family ion channel [Foetidibacter luteolus]